MNRGGRKPIQDGWWYRATDEQRLAQVDAAIELGLPARFVAANCGARRGATVVTFAHSHGRSFTIDNGSGLAPARLASRWVTESKKVAACKAARSRYGLFPPRAFEIFPNQGGENLFDEIAGAS